jgi:hypothetical protein
MRRHKIEFVADQIARELRQHGIDAFEGDAHAFLVTVYKDPRLPLPIRIEAAKACVGYEKPKLAAIAVKDANDLPAVIDRVEFVIVDPAPNGGTPVSERIN